MTNYADYDDSDEMRAAVDEMRTAYLAERESELGPEDDWPSSWFTDQS
jgi:hypothetical protein